MSLSIDPVVSVAQAHASAPASQSSRAPASESQLKNAAAHTSAKGPASTAAAGLSIEDHVELSTAATKPATDPAVETSAPPTSAQRVPVDTADRIRELRQAGETPQEIARSLGLYTITVLSFLEIPPDNDGDDTLAAPAR